MLYKTKYKSPLGMITIVCNEKLLLETGLETQACLLAESAQFISRNEIATVCGTGADEAGIKGKKTETEDAGRKNASELMKRVLNWFDLYFAGNKPDPQALPLAPRGMAGIACNSLRKNYNLWRDCRNRCQKAAQRKNVCPGSGRGCRA